MLSVIDYRVSLFQNHAYARDLNLYPTQTGTGRISGITGSTDFPSPSSYLIYIANWVGVHDYL